MSVSQAYKILERHERGKYEFVFVEPEKDKKRNHWRSTAMPKEVVEWCKKHFADGSYYHGNYTVILNTVDQAVQFKLRWM